MIKFLNKIKDGLNQGIGFGLGFVLVFVLIFGIYAFVEPSSTPEINYVI